VIARSNFSSMRQGGSNDCGGESNVSNQCYDRCSENCALGIANSFFRTGSVINSHYRETKQ
jgi:hypothetical protein